MHFRELTDRYSLDKILRSTRTGTVLRATDSRSGQAVAVKLINVASPADLVQRAPAFEKLTAALEALRHPNLPLILDSGFTTEGSAFLVMEMLEGKTLDTASGPPLRLLTLLFQALNGLEAMARRGIAHGNVTPDNLLLVVSTQAGTQAEKLKILGLGTGLFRGPATDASDWRADLDAFAQSCCQILGANIEAGEPPVVQLPFALSLELENSEALRQTLERALRPNPAERPSHQEIRDAFRLALGVSEVPAPVEEKPAPGPKLVIPAAAVLPSAPPPQDDGERPQQTLRPVPPLPIPGPAAAAAAAVPVPEPDDTTGGELLSFDDDLLAPLPPPAPVQPAAPAAPAAATVIPFNRPFNRRPTPPPQGRGGVAAAVPPKPPSPLRNPIVLLGIAAGLILVLGAAYWWVGRGAVPEAPPIAAAPAAPPPPSRQARDVLGEAQLAFADGQDDRALEILRSLTAADQSALGPAGCRSLQSLEDTLLLSALDGLPDNLAKGLKGDMGRLRFAVMTAAGQEASLPEPLRPDLERARGLVDLYTQIGAAADRKAHTEVLDRFAVLSEQLPNATDPLGLRDHAAEALEEEAEALARDGKYQDAVAHLDPVLRAWPGRPGLKAKIDGYQKAQHDEAQQEQILAEIPGLERRHHLDEALDRMRGLTPTPHLAAQFADVRQRLEGQLAQVDGQPPQVELRDGFLLDYDRGRVVQLSFRVTDDYKVREVKFVARPAGGKMRELPLNTSRLGYTVEIPPAFHQNGTVDFYVTATDVSGHSGSFGTPDHPQQLKRREGFQRILR
jgi:hypothetical protein